MGLRAVACGAAAGLLFVTCSGCGSVSNSSPVTSQQRVEASSSTGSAVMSNPSAEESTVSIWTYPVGVLRLAASGQDMPPREGWTDADGNLVRADGSRQVVSNDIRGAMASWLADPRGLADAVLQLNCQLGADQPFLALTLMIDTDVPQPIRVCLEDADRVPGGQQVRPLADLL